MNRSLRVGIVGGSLSGMCTAVVLARLGHDVTVLEKSRGQLRERGAGLGFAISNAERWRSLGLFDEDLVGIRVNTRRWSVKDGNSDLGRTLFEHPMAIENHSWGSVYGQLLKRSGKVSVEPGMVVEKVTSNDELATVHLVGGSQLSFDLVVGADGYQSVVQAGLFPSAEKHFAGYVAWRGIVSEARLSDISPVVGVMESVGTPRGNAIFNAIPGQGGTTEEGSRLVTLLWYEAHTPLDILPTERGPDGKQHPTSIPAGSMSQEVLTHLNTMADEVLPAWHADVVHRSRDPFLQPIYDVRQDHYVHKRVALVGDAASTARPHTGSGASKGIGDAVALAEALDQSTSVEEALHRYDAERVRTGDEIVTLGRLVGDDTILNAPDWHHIDQDDMAKWIETGPQSLVYYHVNR